MENLTQLLRVPTLTVRSFQ